MQGDLQSSVLWEDLNEIEVRIEKTLATLQSLQHAIEEGRIGQPTRQDTVWSYWPSFCTRKLEPGPVILALRQCLERMDISRRQQQHHNVFSALNEFYVRNPWSL
jgi:hypothetical protein